MRLFPDGIDFQRLAKAVGQGDAVGTKAALDSGTSPHVLVLDRGQTLLAWAVETQPMPVVGILLEAGADPAWTGGGTALQAVALVAWMRRRGVDGLEEWLNRFPSLARPDALAGALTAACTLPSPACFSLLLATWVEHFGASSLGSPDFAALMRRLARNGKIDAMRNMVARQPSLLANPRLRGQLLADAVTGRQPETIAWLLGHAPDECLEGAHPARLAAIRKGNLDALKSMGPSWSGWETWRAQVQAAMYAQSANGLKWVWDTAPGGHPEKREHLGHVVASDGSLLEPLALVCHQGDPRRAGTMVRTLMGYGYIGQPDVLAKILARRSTEERTRTPFFSRLLIHLGESGVAWNVQARETIAATSMGPAFAAWDARRQAAELATDLPSGHTTRMSSRL